MNDELHTRFEDAVKRSKELSEKPGPATLLRIYALYKQATLGDASGERPGMTDFVARSKWDAWAALKGMAGDEAKTTYTALIDSLE